MELIFNYFSFLSRLVTILITLCALLIPACAIGFLLLRRWIQKRAASQERTTPGDRSKVSVAFFHPYCNAGGGGERVLWVAIRAIQKKYPDITCVVYTGDTNVTAERIIARARERFNVSPEKPVKFVVLKRRVWVEASTYPYFTLLGQSLGSMILGWEALTKFVPSIYIDSMGYAFTLPLFKYLGLCKVGCYVHYPTISTDMLSRVAERSDTFNNPSFVARSSFLSGLKIIYYRMFASLYGMMGKCSEVAMVNSTWTKNHICDLWKIADRTHIVYPPCNTDEFLNMPLEKVYHHPCKTVVSIAQFRPEKDHPLQIKAFDEFLRLQSFEERKSYKLVLIGSCRNAEDDERVERLKVLCEVLAIEEYVDFKINISFTSLKEYLHAAYIGLHTMWNEHFGIGVVECMAAGPVMLAHDSGGPKMDIVKDFNGEKTGYLASDVNSYADAMDTILHLTDDERLAIRQNARRSVTRFSDEKFETSFLSACEVLFQKRPSE